FSCFFFSSRRRHTRFSRDWSSDVCSSDLRTGNRSLIDFAKSVIDPLLAVACLFGSTLAWGHEIRAAEGVLAALVFALIYPATVPFRQRSRRSEEHTSELQSRENLVCRLLL